MPLSRRATLMGLSATILALDGAARAQDAGTKSVSPASPKRISLEFAPLKKRLKADTASEAAMIGINGTTPGPLIRFQRGDSVEVMVKNGLAEPITFHPYGIRGDFRQDGVAGLSQEPIAPGGTGVTLLSTSDAGLYWYQSLVQGRAASQLERGLYGPIIVDEANPPDVDRDIVVIIDDIALATDGAVKGDEMQLADAARGGRLGNVLLANGAQAPETMPLQTGSRIRLRVIGASNARLCPLKFDGMDASVVAMDGQPCDPFDPLKRTVILAPGSRFDVIADLPREAGKEAVLKVDLGPGLPVLRMPVDGAALPQRAPRAGLEPNQLPPAIRLQNAWRSELTIEGGMPQPKAGEAADPAALQAAAKARFKSPGDIFTMNFGFKAGFDAAPLLKVKRGLPVVIAITNKTEWEQVIRVHGHVFRLLHNFDDGWEPYFTDTIYVPPGQISRIAFDASNVGKWAIRSAIAEHFDAGIASWYEVTE